MRGVGVSRCSSKTCNVFVNLIVIGPSVASSFTDQKAIVLFAAEINSSGGLFRINIVSVLVRRTQACGLEGKISQTRGFELALWTGMLIFDSLSLGTIVHLLGIRGFHPIEWMCFIFSFFIYKQEITPSTILDTHVYLVQCQMRLLIFLAAFYF